VRILLDAIPSQYHIFIGIGGLVFLMLFIVSAAQKYQAYQYQKEVALRRMLRGIQNLEYYVSRVDGAGVPKALLVMIHKEILARYVAMHHIHKNMENIEQLTHSAQNKLQAIESAGESRVNKPNDRQVLNHYIGGLSGLIHFLHTQGHLAGMNEIQRTKYEHELSSIRAQLIFDFNLDEAKGMASQQLWTDASRYIREIMSFIQSHGPATDRTTKLYHQANKYYQQVIAKQVPGEPPPPVNSTATDSDTMTEATSPV
jgi:hypothetical protein